MSSTPHSQGEGDLEQPPPSKSSSPPHILIFGETGVGKSSIINMLRGKDIAETSGDTRGQTFENVPYPITIDISTESLIDDTTNTHSKDIIAWDTAGLNEAERGKVSHKQAMKNIRNLVGKLDDGLSLLVYVIRGWRLSTVLKTNYDIFVTGLCQRQVPVVLVVTGCENDSPMDNWWTQNERVLDAHDLHFESQACITSTRGKIKDGEHVYEEEYKESEAKVRDLVVKNLRETPWVADDKSLQETDGWFFHEGTFNRTELRVQKQGIGPQDSTHTMRRRLKPTNVPNRIRKERRGSTEYSGRSKFSEWGTSLSNVMKGIGWRSDADSQYDYESQGISPLFYH